jgi:hypothetical protein
MHSDIRERNFALTEKGPSCKRLSHNDADDLPRMTRNGREFQSRIKLHLLQIKRSLFREGAFLFVVIRVNYRYSRATELVRLSPIRKTEGIFCTFQMSVFSGARSGTIVAPFAPASFRVILTTAFLS